MKKKLLLIALLCPLLSFSQNTVKYFLNKAEREYSSGDYKQAIFYYTEVLKLNPTDAWWWMARGEAKFKIKDTVGAISDLNKSIQIDSNFSNGYFQRGYIKSQIGDKEGSDWDFNKSEDLKHPFFDKGRLELQKGGYRAALKDFLISLSLHPKEADIYFELATTERRLNDSFDSEIYLKKAILLYNGL